MPADKKRINKTINMEIKIKDVSKEIRNKEITNILIKKVRIADPSHEEGFTSDILIENGIIRSIKKSEDENSNSLTKDGSKTSRATAGDLALSADGAMAEFYADGLIASPAFFDMHVHIREPGNEQEEDIESASGSALRGGIAAICSMPNTDPPVDSEYLVRYIRSRAEKVGFNIFPVAAMTKNLEGDQITEIGLLKSAGAAALSDDGKCVQDSKLMYEIMKYSRQFDMPLILHEEDYTFSRPGFVNEGYYSAKLGLDGVSSLSEELIIARDLMLAEKTGAKIHITHISSKKSVDLVRMAKEAGIRVTCDVTPHHIFFNDSHLDGYSTNFKVNPPIRSEEDRQALIEGLKQGIIDVIASDHAPHLEEEKNTTFKEAAFGVIGMETLFNASYTCLCKTGKFKLTLLLRSLTENPFKVFGFRPFRIKTGEKANIVLIDPGREVTVEKSSFFSKSSNSPFTGRKLFGEIKCTINNGKIAYFL